MKIKRALPILWLPLLALWSFLFAIQSNITPTITSTNLEDLVPLISYFLVSFLLVLQLQLVLGDKKESGIVKFGTVNVLSICLSISSISIFLNLFESLDNQLSLLLIISPLISNTIIAEVFSVSNKEIVKKKDAWVRTNQELEEKQIKASVESAKERNISQKIREDWKEYLRKTNLNTVSPEVRIEIERIKEIVDFSSYFRTSSSSAILEQLKNELDQASVLRILREVK